ncbi:MAG: hypothetical protein M1823_003536 [Watsoniomyces obsoletus]|nr:MAG: hypothetical protein M1823_003536 [Watsoniomyces obsoletus]
MGPLSWPSSSAMGANGSSGPSAEGTSSSQGQPQGTEYTLQGVMRFLQMQWHRHERDRNGWDVERAEMKMRIAKLEGDQRTNKKLQESLSNHVKLLENALKREREKSKGGGIAEEPAKNAIIARKGESQKSLAPDVKPPTPHHNSFLEVSDPPSSQSKEEPERSKTRGYLDKSVQEVTYLLTAPPHSQRHHVPSQDLMALQGYGVGGTDPIPILAEVSSLQQAQQQQRHPNQNLHHQQQQQQQQQGDISLTQPSPSPRHQPPPVPSSVAPETGHVQGNRGGLQPTQMTRDHQQPPSSSQQVSLFQAENASRGGRGVMSSSHTSESEEQLGRRKNQAHDTSGGIDSEDPETSNPNSWSDPDAWNFDDTEATTNTNPTQLQRNLEVDRFPNPNNANHVPKSPPRTGLDSHRRKGSMSRRRSDEAQAQKDSSSSSSQSHLRADTADFKVRFALRGHLDVVRAVIFTGGGSPSEPEICTAGDDGVLKRWIIPASYSGFGPTGASGNTTTHHHHHHDLDVVSYFTHRGHTGAVTCLAACPSPQNFLTGGRALGDGWVFSGGQDATVKVWERGRVDPKATLIGHTDAVWSICVLPTTAGSIFGSGSSDNIGGGGGGVGGDRLLLASGASDGMIKIWAVSAPPQSLSSSHSGSRRGVGGSRRHSVTSGSGFPSSPQPSTATSTPFHHILMHTIARPGTTGVPTCIAPAGNTFVAGFNDAAVIIFDTRTGEEVVGMASLETYNGTPATGVNAVVATTGALDSVTNNAVGGDVTMTMNMTGSRGLVEDEGRVVHGATGSGSTGGIEGVVISGHEDRYIRFFDANSGE